MPSFHIYLSIYLSIFNFSPILESFLLRLIHWSCFPFLLLLLSHPCIGNLLLSPSIILLPRECINLICNVWINYFDLLSSYIMHLLLIIIFDISFCFIITLGADVFLWICVLMISIFTTHSKHAFFIVASFVLLYI